MINQFRRSYDFLSNFYPCEVELDGVNYPSVEHAFVAAKCKDLVLRKHVKRLESAADAKKFGRILRLREDWEEVKLSIMKDLVSKKFQYPDLREKLLQTGTSEIVECNNWGDKFWGVCDGVGENHLGRILMEVRDEAVRDS